MNSYVFFVGAFTLLRKATFSFVHECLSVCLSADVEQLGSNWTDFSRNVIFEYFHFCTVQQSLIYKL